jgi:hypothetical protein
LAIRKGDRQPQPRRPTASALSHIPESRIPNFETAPKHIDPVKVAGVKNGLQNVSLLFLYRKHFVLHESAVCANWKFGIN